MRCARCNNNLEDQATVCERCGLVPNAEGVDPLIGTVIKGKYRVEKRIGAGGMGTVYLGKWLLFGQNVAIKILHSRAANSFATAKRFELEAHTYAQLNHHNLVSLRDYGQTPEGTVFMVLEYCPGETLSKILRTRQKLPPLMAIEFCLQIAAGLVEAHAHHIVHRDLKPDNIMVETMSHNSYHLKLLDFGIAKNIAQDKGAPMLTSAQTAVGTPEYMAPEQARGNAVDGRTDIYALGIVLYELVCGRPPFIAQNGNKLAVMTDQTSTLPPPPHVFLPDIPPELEALILRCLEKLPEHRFQTASDLITALTRVQNIIKEGQTLAKNPTMPMLPAPSIDEHHLSPSISLKMPRAISQTLDSRPISQIDPPHGLTPLQLGIGLSVFVVLIALVAIFTSRNAEPVNEDSGDPSKPVVAQLQTDQVKIEPVADQAQPQEKPVSPAKALSPVDPQSIAQQTAWSWLQSIPPYLEQEHERITQENERARAAEEEQKRLRDAELQRQQQEAEQQRLQKEAEQKRLQEENERNQEAKREVERALADFKKARKLLRTGDFEEASGLIEDALKRKPDLSRADLKSFQDLRSDLNRLRSQLSMAKLSYDSKDCAHALEMLEALAKAAPESKAFKKMVNECRRQLSDE